MIIHALIMPKEVIEGASKQTSKQILKIWVKTLTMYMIQDLVPHFVYSSLRH